jgi:hypothetical protein
MRSGFHRVAEVATEGCLQWSGLAGFLLDEFAGRRYNDRALEVEEDQARHEQQRA